MIMFSHPSQDTFIVPYHTIWVQLLPYHLPVYLSYQWFWVPFRKSSPVSVRHHWVVPSLTFITGVEAKRGRKLEDGYKR